MLYADDEPSAEVYSAASDRSQASLVFNVAKQIVEMTPALMKRSKIMAATKRIVNYSNAGFYQVLSADVGCVSEDTVLQLSDGSLKRADEIQLGDMILSFDGLTPVFDEVVSVREEERRTFTDGGSFDRPRSENMCHRETSLLQNGAGSEDAGPDPCV